ncbi:MAG: sigma-70 family RNA polymerase sigma factor [Proteobacteria bacterium]|nr:sigma-70 family RNA polymerase sigma factor [Pseudomonadota bacterium]
MSHFNQTIDVITFKAACRYNTAAQKHIYEVFSSAVYNLVFRITLNEADALDISQDVFIKVLTKIKQNKSPDLLGFWIRKIALNTTLTYINKHSRLITNINFQEQTIDSDINETLSSLEFALAKLPTISRSILWMYEVEGMSHQEIADIYGKSISFSKTHLSRAKNLAQSFLISQTGGYEAVK